VSALPPQAATVRAISVVTINNRIPLSYPPARLT